MKRFGAIDRTISTANVLRLWFVGVIHAVIFHTASNVGAEEPTWRLEYRRSKDAPSNCPDESYLRTALAAKNGARQPFSNDASRTIVIDVAPTTERIEARIQVKDEHDNLVSESIAHAPSWRCDQLADRIVFILRDIVDPISIPEPAPAAVSSTPTAPSTQSLVPEKSPPKQTLLVQPIKKPANSSSKAQLTLALGLGATWWSAPNTALSSALGIGLRWSRFSVGIEGRYDRAWKLPLTQAVHGEQVGLAMIVCGYHGFRHPPFYVRGCMLAGVTMLSAGTEQLRAFEYATPLIDLGARAGVGISVGRMWSIEVHGDGIVVVQQPRFMFNDGEGWRLPRFNGALRANLVGLFDVF